MQKAAELLREANGKYNAKDLMGALKLYEDVLNQVRHARPACRKTAAACRKQRLLAGTQLVLAGQQQELGL
jgi:hypothetical protein